MAKNNGREQQQQSGQAKEIPANDELLTVSQVAALFKVHRNTVDNWIAAKAIVAVRTPGGHPRVWRSHVATIIGVASASV